MSVSTFTAANCTEVQCKMLHHIPDITEKRIKVYHLFLLQIWTFSVSVRLDGVLKASRVLELLS